ncbi:MAG: sugar ABC transporter permease [Clostridia bacterium]|nr:sugar ABC transporter permease [Clostridia bacterium]
MKRTFGYKLSILAFLLPALILFLGILIAPIIMSGVYSLFNWKVGYPLKDYIGYKNYVELFTSKSIRFTPALGNSLMLALFSVFIQLPLALILALKLGKKIPGERAFLSVFFMPVLISTVVIGQLWLKIYNPEYGLLNVFLRAVGLEKWTRIWLGQKDTALGACFVPILWQYVGYHMLLMYAGVKGVPVELNEAAMLDGCTESQVNRYIIIPYIKPILKVSVIFAVTGSLKSFDMIYVLTNGGPLHATEVPSTLMISMLFLRNRYGMGSTIAVMLIVLCFAFALLISLAFKEEK